MRRRRFKTTTYGQRGGEGPNKGKKATTWKVELPDGTIAKKRSMNVGPDEDAWGLCSEYQGVWYLDGIMGAERKRDLESRRSKITFIVAAPL